MSENEIDRIPKLLFPLYTLETEPEQGKFGIETDWKKCNRCGSHAFYVSESHATKNQKELDKGYIGIPLLVDINFICAECGHNCGGIIQNHKFSELKLD